MILNKIKKVFSKNNFYYGIKELPKERKLKKKINQINLKEKINLLQENRELLSNLNQNCPKHIPFFNLAFILPTYYYLYNMVEDLELFQSYLPYYIISSVIYNSIYYTYIWLNIKTNKKFIYQDDLLKNNKFENLVSVNIENKKNELYETYLMKLITFSPLIFVGFDFFKDYVPIVLSYNLITYFKKRNS